MKHETNYNTAISENEANDTYIYDTLENLKEEDLPLTFELDDIYDYNTDDIRAFSENVMAQTGFGCSFHFTLCRDCGKLHCIIRIDK